MGGVYFDDKDFFRDQQEDDRHWKWPFNLAVGLHIVVFAASIWLPDLIERRPLLDNVVTVDLVSMPDMTAPPAVAQPPAKASKPAVEPPPVQPTEPPPVEAAAAVAVAPEPVVEPEPAAPVKPVSLTPRKRKVKKARDTRLAEEKEKEQRLKATQQKKLKRKKEEQARRRADKLKRQRALADARRAQREADRAAARARQELASVIRQSGPSGGAARSSGSSSGRQVQSVVLKQYLSSMYDRVHSYWILPEMRNWDRSLETVVVLTIRRDGSVTGMQVERKSGDAFFDQFVMKTLQTALPMPRFPALMSQPSIEVGLRFKPGELKM